MEEHKGMPTEVVEVVEDDFADSVTELSTDSVDDDLPTLVHKKRKTQPPSPNPSIVATSVAATSVAAPSVAASTFVSKADKAAPQTPKKFQKFVYGTPSPVKKAKASPPVCQSAQNLAAQTLRSNKDAHRALDDIVNDMRAAMYLLSQYPNGKAADVLTGRRKVGVSLDRMSAIQVELIKQQTMIQEMQKQISSAAKEVNELRSQLIAANNEVDAVKILLQDF